MPLEDCMCRESAAASGVTDLSWWCWMFGCQACVRAHHICGRDEAHMSTDHCANPGSCWVHGLTDEVIAEEIRNSHQQLTGGTK